jgi:hypothetical protein
VNSYSYGRTGQSFAKPTCPKVNFTSDSAHAEKDTKRDYSLLKQCFARVVSM